MPWYDQLIEQGYTPGGISPNVITEPGASPQPGIGTDNFSNLLRALQKNEEYQKMKFQEQQKKVKSQADMYTTLRDAGYDPKAAYEAAQGNQFPSQAGGETGKAALELQKQQADIGYKQAETKKIETELSGGGAAGRRTDQLKFANSTKLRQEFIRRPEVQDYVKIKTNVDSMESLLNEALKGNVQNAVALDQGLITMYNKLTDPQSVVRESEYARTPANLPVTNAILGAIQKVQAGGAGLTNSDRAALVQGAKIIANERGKTYNKTLSEYQGLASKYDMDVDLVTRGQAKHSNYQIGQQGESSINQIQEGQTATNPSTGQKIVYRGGQWQQL